MGKTIQAALLRWFDREKRDMPWRRTRDPYRIWLSEVMLQQTRVETVVGYWDRFLERFPTIEALAAAKEQEVLKAWEGLGYYARARNLHRAAKEVVSSHGGQIPSDEETFHALPGVGDYTAGAVLSIAFGNPLPAVDGNVLRVLCRLDDIREDPRQPELFARLRERAASLVDRRRPGDWTQAVMELGATVCLPREPHCLLCPLSSFCKGRQAGVAATLPVRPPRRAPHEWEQVCVVVKRKDRLLLVRRPEEGLLGGLWEMPSGERRQGEPLPNAVRRVLRDTTGLSGKFNRELGEVRHVFTHARLTLHVCALDGVRGRARNKRLAWCDAREREALPLSAVARKSLSLVPLTD